MKTIMFIIFHNNQGKENIIFKQPISRNDHSRSHSHLETNQTLNGTLLQFRQQFQSVPNVLLMINLPHMQCLHNNPKLAADSACKWSQCNITSVVTQHVTYSKALRLKSWFVSTKCRFQGKIMNSTGDFHNKSFINNVK